MTEANRTLWGISCLWAAVCLSSAGSGTATAASISLASHGVALAEIVIADDADAGLAPVPAKKLEMGSFPIEFGNIRSSVRETAGLLADYLERATGAEFAVRKESDPPALDFSIHLGKTAYARQTLNDLDTLDQDGFIIGAPDDTHVVIVGGSNLGAEHGVYEFLERHAGVRWLFPDTRGEHVPRRATLNVPPGISREEPAFLTRRTRSLVPGGDEWTRRNRLSWRVEFHHNIAKLFKAGYAREHPEIFPLLDGQRYLPTRDNMVDWHLCYSATNLADFSIALITNFFATYPQYQSISLGVSDAGAACYCQCDACRARYTGRKNTLGFDDRSDLYYPWVNQVVAGVRAVYPEKYFGAIAYREVTDPPTRIDKLDEHFVPFICMELLMWRDPRNLEKGQNLTKRWGKVAHSLGWYDYNYGKMYQAPRFYPHHVQECLRFLYANKVQHYFAESVPAEDWHEGPKLYILAKLLWNPDADVDALLDDWHTCAVGAEAAPFLAQYFSFWEEYWTQRTPGTDWFHASSERDGAVYLNFSSRGYLACLQEEDLAQCSAWLAAAVEKAGTPQEKARARFFQEGFERRREQILDYNARFNGLQRLLPDAQTIRIVSRCGVDADGAGWAPYRNLPTARWAPDAGRNGGGALAFDPTGAFDYSAAIFQPINVRTGTLYRLSGWYRADGAAPSDPAIRMLIEWRDQKGNAIDYDYLIDKFLPAGRDAKGEYTWRYLDMLLTPPPLPKSDGGAMLIKLLVNVPENSSARFADLTVAEISPNESETRKTP